MSAARQQINLYRPHLQGRRGPFGAGTLGLLTASISVALVVLWSLDQRQVSALQRSVSDLEQQQQAQQQMLAALGNLVSATGGSGDIEARIQRLRTELQTRERVLALLKQGTIGRTVGFSPDLAALARHPFPGLWLERVTISGLTGAMSLQGDAEDPDSVPRYLGSLANERALSGLRFERLVIERHTPSAGKGIPRTGQVGFEFTADGTPADAQLADALVSAAAPAADSAAIQGTER
jgi:hypothetical protein